MCLHGVQTDDQVRFLLKVLMCLRLCREKRFVRIPNNGARGKTENCVWDVSMGTLIVRTAIESTYVGVFLVTNNG